MALNIFTISNQLVEAMDLCLKGEIGEEVIIAISRVKLQIFILIFQKKKKKTLHSSISNLVVSVNTKIKDNKLMESLNNISNNILKNTKELQKTIQNQTEEFLWKNTSQDKISVFKEQLEGNNKIFSLQSKLDQERKLLQMKNLEEKSQKTKKK